MDCLPYTSHAHKFLCLFGDPFIASNIGIYPMFALKSSIILFVYFSTVNVEGQLSAMFGNAIQADNCAEWTGLMGLLKMSKISLFRMGTVSLFEFDEIEML